MNWIRISRRLLTVATRACRFAGLPGSGARPGVPRRRRGRGGVVWVFAVVVALLAALGGPGLAPSAALASSPPVPNWTKLSPATHPGARYEAAMAYDAATGTTVLFGGGRSPYDGVNGSAFGPTYFDGTWVWNGSTWAEQHPATHPGPLADAEMAYDAATGTVVLFGGVNNKAAPRATWTWNGTTWTKQHPATSPPGSWGGAMAYDAATGTVVLFSGCRREARDTWTWNGTTWTRQRPGTAPLGRCQGSMAYDAATGDVVLFGGDRPGHGELADTWTWNGTTWTQQAPATSPSTREGAAMAYDPATGNVVLFSGSDCGCGATLAADTWTWNGTTWTQQAPATSPPTRWVATMAYDAATSTLVLFGGQGNRERWLSDTWAWGSN
jgi:hypothetical protein